jgi:hypothetical protein
MDIEIEFVLKVLHPKQQSIIDKASRFNHLRCGRRWGKTSLIEELCNPVLDGWPVGIWFPTYKDLSEVWKEVKLTYKPVTSKVNEQLKQITMITNGLIDFWSMDEPDSGQGRKYKRVIIDEAAKAPKLYQAWENTIRPTLTDYQGDAFIMSRPKGKNNGFHQLEVKHHKFDNWSFFHFTTYDNPHIKKEEVDEARVQLDDLTFRQEYLAEYVDANDKPYLYAFQDAVHVISDYKINPHLNLLISFDFNKEPMTALVAQQPTVGDLVIFDEIRINSGSTPEVCDHILAKYNKFIGKMEVTGDATGRNRTSMVRGNVNHYIIIKEKLQLKDNQLIVPRQNNSHENSRILCNSVIQNANFRITKNCEATILDCTYAAVDEFGELIKTQQEGRHFFDNVRYLIEAGFKDFITKPHKYG